MGYLEKNFLLHKRNEKGELLPLDYDIKEFEQFGNSKVSIIPATRGELLDIVAKIRVVRNKIDVDVDGLITEEWEKFVINHFAEPKFTKEELRDAKRVKYNGKTLDLIDILTEAIFAISGTESTDTSEEELKKNSIV